jgi:hypothetical protein
VTRPYLDPSHQRDSIRVGLLTLLLAVVAACAPAASGSPGPDSAEATVSSAPSPPPPATPSPSPAYDAPEDLNLGDCFNAIEDKDDRLRILAVVVVPCDQQHTMEVVGVDLLPDLHGPEWSVLARMDAESERLCRRAFRDYVGVSYDLSSLQGGWLMPNEAEFAVGIRDVTCFVETHPAAPFTDSVRGTAR